MASCRSSHRHYPYHRKPLHAPMWIMALPSQVRREPRTKCLFLNTCEQGQLILFHYTNNAANSWTPMPQTMKSLRIDRYLVHNHDPTKRQRRNMDPLGNAGEADLRDASPHHHDTKSSTTELAIFPPVFQDHHVSRY